MSDQIKQVTDASFDQDVLQAAQPIVVDFWAPWCGPCKMVAPIVEELAREYAGKVSFAKLNTDESMDTAVKLGIRSIPTLIFYSGGKEVDRAVGYVPKPALKLRVDALLKAGTPK